MKNAQKLFSFFYILTALTFTYISGTYCFLFPSTYYNSGYLDPVPKTDGLPKKLIYKFGQKATGWQRKSKL